MARVRPARRRLGRWRLAVVVALALAAVLVLRVTVAPLDLPLAGWLARQLEARTGAPVTVGSVALRMGAGRLHLLVRNLRMRTPGASFSLTRLEVTQGFATRAVALHAPRVTLDPSQAGPRTAAVPAPALLLAGIDAALTALAQTFREGGLARLSVADGRLDIVSAGRPVTEARVFQDIVVDVSAGEGLTLAARLVGADGPIVIDASRSGGTTARTVTVFASGIAPRDIATMAAVQSGFPMSGILEARFAQDRLAEATLDVSVGRGTVVFGIDPPRTLDSARIRLSLAGGERRLSLLPSTFEAGGSRVTVSGDIIPNEAPGQPWRFALTAPQAQFDPPDVDAEPLTVETLEARGTLDLAERRIVVEALHGRTPGAEADASLIFDLSARGPLLAGAARLGPSSIAVLRRVWPPVIAHEPRVALLSTVLDGEVTIGEMDLALTPLELDGDPATSDMIEGGLSVDMGFAETTLAVPDTPIRIVDARGALSLRDKMLQARLDGGRLALANAAHGSATSLTVVEGRLSIPQLGANPAVATLTATVEGPLSAVVALAEHFDLPQLAEMEVSPDEVTGTVRADLTLVTPLADVVKSSERRWSLEARVTDGGASVPIAGRTVADANLEVRVNRRRIAARGRAVIDGLTVDVDYSEMFAGEKSGAVRVVLSDEDRRKQGFDTGALVRGPVAVTIEAGEAEGRHFTADLTDATVHLPGFAKDPGEPLVAAGTLEGTAPALSVEDLKIDGSGVDIAGTVALGAEGLRSARLAPFAVSKEDAARLSIDGRADGGYRITLDAERFDARGLLKSLSAGGQAEGGVTPPITLAMNGTRVRLSENSFATDVAVSMTHDGRRIQRLAFTGRLDGVGAGAIALKMTPNEDGTRRLQGDVRQLGRLLSAFDLYERMRGGRTTLEARIGRDGVVTGRVVVTDFVLANEATLEEIISRTNRGRVGRDRSPRPLAFQATGEGDGGGLSFDKLIVDFEKRGERILIREATLRGPVLGGTADGQINLATRTLRINGTFIPAYGVNNLFGRVPLVGEILGAGDKGGLIGVTFRLVGPLDSPQLVVNPISAIAPGIFRRIFEFR